MWPKLGHIQMVVNNVLESAVLFIYLFIYSILFYFILKILPTFRILGQANFKSLLKISLKMLLVIWKKQNGIL